MSAVIDKLKKRFLERRTPSESARALALRRKFWLSKGARALPFIQLLLALAGYLQFLALPLPIPQLARKTYIDENAFQPGQVNTYFGWPDVSLADRFSEHLTSNINFTSSERAEYLKEALVDLGLPAALQPYTFDGLSSGTNVYTRIQAPKTSGAEVVVLCAPWKSRQDGLVNVRGTSALLALARHFQKLGVWSKDIVILFSDDDLAGTQAWLHSYHKHSREGLHTVSLTMSEGNIWGAAVLDYPYHSFSHIGVYYDGINGRLPNSDLVTAAVHISRWVGGVPVRLHNQTYIEPFSEDHTAMSRYMQRAKGILEQASYGASTRPSGPEGLFGQYGIDSVGLFSVPAEGPHGFYTIGRVVESLTRAMNNLVERLHASFFLYLLPEPFQFLTVASYLSAPILIGASLTVAGLRLWHGAPPGSGMPALVAVCSTYLASMAGLASTGIWAVIAIIGSGLAYMLLGSRLANQGQGRTVLSLALLQAGMMFSVATILNYALGALLALSLGTPMLVALYARDSATQWRYAVSALPIATVPFIVFYMQDLEPVLNISSAPAVYFVYLVVLPLSLQTIQSLLL